jgi:hypothetical protein
VAGRIGHGVVVSCCSERVGALAPVAFEPRGRKVSGHLRVVGRFSSSRAIFCVRVTLLFLLLFCVGLCVVRRQVSFRLVFDQSRPDAGRIVCAQTSPTPRLTSVRRVFGEARFPEGQVPVLFRTFVPLAKFDVFFDHDGFGRKFILQKKRKTFQ